MKLSLLATAVIVAIFGVLGWQRTARVASARTERERLVAEAQALGIHTENLSADSKTPLPSRIARAAQEHHEADARAFARKLIAFAVEMKEMERKREQPDQAMQQRILEIMDGMLSMDPGQLKVLIAELRGSKELDDDMRRGIMGFAIMMLAQEHPAAALALYTEGADELGKDPGIRRFGMTAALTKWAEEDPMAAMEWIRKNAKDHGELINDETRAAVLAGAAKQDPKVAFSMIADLGLKNSGNGYDQIGKAAATTEERAGLLTALRDYLQKLSDAGEGHIAMQSTLSGMAQRSVDAGYETSAKWLESANLSPEEAKAFASGLNLWWGREDSGKWMEWMAAKAPGEESTNKISESMRQWTQRDYKAAGAWLADNTTGNPAKKAAVPAYAEAVAPYDPETASQWALTMPEGQERKNLLKKIYSEWKGQDEAAAAKFAKSHGVEADP